MSFNTWICFFLIFFFIYKNGIDFSKIYQEMHKRICVTKKANGLNLGKGHNEIKEGQPNLIWAQMSKESKEFRTESKSNSN